MMQRDNDLVAVDVATRRFGLPQSVHVPIAARDLDALERYVGHVEGVLSRGRPVKAVCLRVPEPDTMDRSLSIWRLPESVRLHAPRQLWVHVDFTRYRKAYARAFPEQSLHGLVVDHVMNRRVARLMGFPYVRVVAISRAANCSSGALSEKWGIAFHAAAARTQARDWSAGAAIQYADLADIVKLLDIKTGGALQEAVNDAQRLLETV